MGYGPQAIGGKPGDGGGMVFDVGVGAARHCTKAQTLLCRQLVEQAAATTLLADPCSHTNTTVSDLLWSWKDGE